MKQMKYDDYMKLLNNIVENEFDHACNENLEGMKELEKYNKIGEENEKRYDKLISALPEDLQQLLFDYDAEWNNLMAMEINHYFKKGVVAGTSNLSFIRDITEGYKFY